MVHKSFVSLRRHSKSQRLAFIQAPLHATRNTKEEIKVSFEVCFGNFSLPFFTEIRYQQQRYAVRQNVCQQTTTPNLNIRNGQLQTPSQILMSGWIVSHIGRNSVKRKENAVIVRLVRVVFIVWNAIFVFV